jgi:hypothetical protein
MARSRKKRAVVAPEPKSGISPKWIVTLVGCGLVAYIVIKKVDDISEVKAAGAGITFRGSASPSSLPPEQQRELSRQIQAKIEADLQQAANAEPEPSTSPVDLTGTWTTPDGRASWTVTIENGYVAMREQYPESPNVITAVGYGSFDGHTWSLRLQNIFGATGTASLSLEDDDTLRGGVVLGAQRFLLVLRR